MGEAIPPLNFMKIGRYSKEGGFPVFTITQKKIMLMFLLFLKGISPSTLTITLTKILRKSI
jgi:hypothetical protein